MPSNLRSGRLNEEILREVSDIIKHDLKDPRISPMASVLRAEVTRDLAFAKIHVTVYGDDKAKEDTLTGLIAARGYIRSELSKRMTLRRVPALIFEMDDSIEYAIHMSKLIDDVLKDEQHED